VILSVIAVFIIIRSAPIAAVLMFDPPYPLTPAMIAQYSTVIVGLPLVIAFVVLIEFVRQPITRRLKEPSIELTRPTWPEVRREVLIIVVCMMLAYFVVAGRGS
jgi:hypothetical protein